MKRNEQVAIFLSKAKQDEDLLDFVFTSPCGEQLSWNQRKNPNGILAWMNGPCEVDMRFQVKGSRARGRRTFLEG